jgi:hypothetical protein
MIFSPIGLAAYRVATEKSHAKMAGCTLKTRWCATCKKYKMLEKGHKRLPVFKCAECVQKEKENGTNV